ncbi:FGGY-family carbohydrate kinase [Lacticaseibacillus suibinensis]|uniref:FGGY-family carbohydrate kinase n=1 Tax=Lacticaseibacillus suibinensis TaxID=2486011 RepID=UPI000F7B52AC|nr:FGGY-family carbohydrate kinase [Lacticaseibacillus suibinensis]
MNLTIDVGTTNTKVSLWKDTLTTVPTEQKKFKTPKIESDDFVDFDADKLFEMILSSIGQFKDTDLAKVAKISIASVGESGVLIDSDGNSASEMIAWYDNRAQSVIDALSDSDRTVIYEVCGLPPNAHYSAAKIRWLLENRVAKHQRYTWLCIPDYIAYRLTGNMATEFSIASRTMAFDLSNRRWSSRVKAIFGISDVDFPPVLAAGESIGSVLPELSQHLAIASDVSVAIAGHDHMVGSFSSSQTKEELLDSTGTTEGILLLNDKLTISPEDQAAGIAYGIYQDPRLYTEFTALPSAGSVIEWFMKSFHFTSEEFLKTADIMHERYLKGNLDEDCINFVIPHFSGSGSPVKTPDTKGLWYGLTNGTSREDLVFGLFLGLTFELKQAIEALHGPKVSRIKLIGPATKDPLWIQLRADLLGVPVLAMETPEAVSRGANIIAEAVDRNYDRPSEAPNNEYLPQQNSITRRIIEIYKSLYKPLYSSKVKIEL